MGDFFKIESESLIKSRLRIPRSYVRFVAEEVAHYKKSLERNRTRYKIVEETTQPDGSIMIRIKKQYNQSPVGDYLNE